MTNRYFFNKLKNKNIRLGFMCQNKLLSYVHLSRNIFLKNFPSKKMY